MIEWAILSSCQFLWLGDFLLLPPVGGSYFFHPECLEFPLFAACTTSDPKHYNMLFTEFLSNTCFMMLGGGGDGGGMMMKTMMLVALGRNPGVQMPVL